MTAIEAIQAGAHAVQDVAAGPAQAAQAAPEASQRFGDLLAGGVDYVDQRVAHAQDLARDFAVDASIPVHQVTIALEQARLAVELAMQVRSRLVEGYRDIMNTQL